MSLRKQFAGSDFEQWWAALQSGKVFVYVAKQVLRLCQVCAVLRHSAAAAVCCLRPGDGAAAISDVDMVVDDAAAEQQATSGGAAARSASPTKQQQHSRGSRWEVDGEEPQAQQQQRAAADAHRELDTTAAALTAAASRVETDAAPTAPASDADAVAVDSSCKPVKKKLKLSVDLGLDDTELDIDHEALLAGVNQALEQLDADQQQHGSGRGVAAAAGAEGDSGRDGRGKAGGGGASSMSLGASYSSGGGSKAGILKTCSTPGSKKKVRWPDDLPPGDEEAGFAIARTPRQVRRRGGWAACVGCLRLLLVLPLVKQNLYAAYNARCACRLRLATHAGNGTGVVLGRHLHRERFG
jgi:hypothetical protein